jgi:methyl-accepting chemotaxis protein
LKRSLPAQFLLGAFISVSVLLLAAVFLEANRDRAVLLRQFDRTARRNASLLLHSIEQPMARGDDAGTAAEFGKIAEKFPGLHFSIASFNGLITYSTRPSEIRARVEEAHSGSLGRSYLDALDGRFSGPDGAAAGQSGGQTENGVFTRLIKKDGRNQVMLLAPIDNRPECYHCHGWTQPVLGAAALFTDVEEELAAFSRQSLALGGYALILAGFVTGVLYFFMRRRFFRRLDLLTARAGRISDWEEAPVEAAGSGAEQAKDPAAADPLDHASQSLEKVSRVMEHLDFLESVLESLPLAVAVCNVQGRVAFVSRAFINLLGKSGETREALLGRPLAELVYGQPHAQSVFARMLRDKSANAGQGLEESLTAPGGEKLRLRLDAALVYAGSAMPGAPLTRMRPEIIGQPELMGILCIFREISVEKRARAALEAREAELRELYCNAGLILAKLREAASALAGRLEQAREAAAGQQAEGRSEVPALQRLGAVLNKLAGHWSEFMEQTRQRRQAAQAGNEDLRALGEAVQQLGRTVLRFREEAGALEECGRAFIDKAQSSREVADQINLMALDAALEAAAAGISPLSASGARAWKKAEEGATEVLALFGGEARRGRPRAGGSPAANLAAAAVLGALVDRLRALADVSGQAAEELKKGLLVLSERGKNSREAAEASAGHMDEVIRLLLSGDENFFRRMAQLDALLAKGAEVEAELQERLAKGEVLDREAAGNGAMAQRTLQAIQSAEASAAALLNVIDRMEEVFSMGRGVEK